MCGIPESIVKCSCLCLPVWHETPTPQMALRPVIDGHVLARAGSGQGGLQGFRAYVNPHAKPEALNLPVRVPAIMCGMSIACASRYLSCVCMLSIP